VRWIENWLNGRTQRVVISSAESSWKLVTSGVPHGSVLSPVLFSFFIHDLDEGTECTLSKFADDTKLGGVAGTPEGCAAIQRDLDRLASWTQRNLMKFNKGKCRVLHRERTNPMHQYRLGTDLLESSSAERDLGMLVDNKLMMSQQCGQEVEGGYPPPLLCPGEAPSGVLRSSSGLPSSRKMRNYWRVQWRATKMMRGLEHLSCKERLRELGLFSLKKAERGSCKCL